MVCPHIIQVLITIFMFYFILFMLTYCMGCDLDIFSFKLDSFDNVFRLMLVYERHGLFENYLNFVHFFLLSYVMIS